MKKQEDEFEKGSGLVAKAFRALQKSAPRSITKVSIPAGTSEAEREYAVERLRKAGWVACVTGNVLVLRDPPSKRATNQV